MKKIKNKKNIKKVTHFDNKIQLSNLVKRLYSAILKLDTKTLSLVSSDIYSELISREDFNSLNEEIIRFQILYDDLIEKGVDVSCLM